ncbi:MAG: TerB N-terminal domain-containing protein, partial [Kiritimatiellaeota bacterium]|nr:TerB N-terminal domain-containing protein [Kiritimatiellota bacterium]
MKPRLSRVKNYGTFFSMPSPPASPSQPGLFSDVAFAEIELDFDAPATPPQPVAARAPDPAREKFYEMRSLASGSPFARHDAELFYRQAKFMEDFYDDYEGGAPFSMYYPCHQQMSSEQLRTYFTWRASARRGHFSPTSLSYVFVYVYELLAPVG